MECRHWLGIDMCLETQWQNQILAQPIKQIGPSISKGFHPRPPFNQPSASITSAPIGPELIGANRPGLLGLGGWKVARGWLDGCSRVAGGFVEGGGKMAGRWLAADGKVAGR